MGQKSNEMKPYFNSKTTGRSNCLDLFTNTSAYERWNNVLGFVLVAKVIQFLPHSGDPFHLVTIASVTRDTRVLQETKLTI